MLVLTVLTELAIWPITLDEWHLVPQLEYGQLVDPYRWHWLGLAFGASFFTWWTSGVLTELAIRPIAGGEWHLVPQLEYEQLIDPYRPHLLGLEFGASFFVNQYFVRRRGGLAGAGETGLIRRVSGDRVESKGRGDKRETRRTATAATGAGESWRAGG